MCKDFHIREGGLDVPFPRPSTKYNRKPCAVFIKQTQEGSARWREEGRHTRDLRIRGTTWCEFPGLCVFIIIFLFFIFLP